MLSKVRENDKVFNCNDLARIISEICGISRRLAAVINREIKSIYLDDHEQGSLFQ